MVVVEVWNAILSSGDGFSDHRWQCKSTDDTTINIQFSEAIIEILQCSFHIYVLMPTFGDHDWIIHKVDDQCNYLGTISVFSPILKVAL